MKKRLNFSENFTEILAFALPILLEQFSLAFMAIISTMLVAGAGAAAVSGVNLVESMNFLIQQVFLGLEIGAIVVVAQYCGRGEMTSAKKTSLQAMYSSLSIALLMAVLFFVFPDIAVSPLLKGAEADVYNAGRMYFRFSALSYPFLAIYSIAAASLRGSGNPKLSLIGVMVTNASFVLLGIFFVNVFDMGVAGVGLALILGRFSGAATGVLLIVKGKGSFCIKSWKLKSFDWKIQKTILMIGIPAMIENMAFTGGRLITQTFTVPLGTSAMAINALANTVCGFYNIPGNTCAVISVPIVGKYLGMKNPVTAKNSSRTILILSTGSVILLSAVFFFLAVPVAGMFSSDSEIISGVAYLFRSYLIVSPFLWSMSFVAPAILRASGDIRFTTIVSLSSMFLFRVTIGYLLTVTFGLGVLGIWIAMYADWLVRSVLFGIRYFKGKWAERVIIKEEAEEVLP